MAELAARRHATAEQILGSGTVVRREITIAESRSANRLWWDADADDYHAEHGEFLGAADFVWCPEGVTEQDARLLGDIRGQRVLELGCGMASCARWLAAQGAQALGLDLSSGMLRYAQAASEATGIAVPLIQGSGDQLPFKANSFDIVCSAFGAVPFVSDLDLLLSEVARVLRSRGRWVFAVTHPMRWVFTDDPGPTGLIASQSYFDRTPYVEVAADGQPIYAEHHRTFGDYVRALHNAGFDLLDVIEPEWPAGHSREWGQWSPLRGEIFPGTAIFCTIKASQ